MACIDGPGCARDRDASREPSDAPQPSPNSDFSDRPQPLGRGDRGRSLLKAMLQELVAFQWLDQTMPGPQAQSLNGEFMPVNTEALSFFGGRETSSSRSIRTSVRHPISAMQHEPQTGKQGPRFVARLNITRGPLTSSGCSIRHSLRHRATAGQTQPLMLIKKCLRWRLPCGTLV